MSAAQNLLFREVIAHFGNQQKTADALQITQASVNGWLAKGRMSTDNALLIQKLTNGKFNALDLRPSLKDHIQSINVA